MKSSDMGEIIRVCIRIFQHRLTSSNICKVLIYRRHFHLHLKNQSFKRTDLHKYTSEIFHNISIDLDVQYVTILRCVTIDGVWIAE
jgi:hypothetical protein